MTTVSTNEFKSGLKVLLDKEPHNIINNEFVKPGKGQAFNRVKLRHLRSGRVIEKTFKSGETIEIADVVELDMQFLYNDGDKYHFMDPKSYEQYEINQDVASDAGKWLKEQDVCQITLWNNAVIGVEPPNFVTLRITETDPGIKGDTASGGSKPATLETGAMVRVPLFIQQDEIIKVDTRTGEYVSRAKE